MESLYRQDLAYIQAAGFAGLARGAASEIVRLLDTAPIQIRRVVEAGCGAGPLTACLVEAGFEVTGIDNSAELLTIARAAAPRARFIHTSVYEAEAWIGLYWLTWWKTRIRGRWSGTSKRSGGSMNSIGVGTKCTEYDFSTRLHSAINSLVVGSRRRQHERMEHSF